MKSPAPSRSLITRRSAFTLVELLTVIAIIGMLAALVLGFAGYANRKAARGKAIGELEKIKNGLEEYRAEYGDYPVYTYTNAGCSTGLAGFLWVQPQADQRINRPFLALEGWSDSNMAYSVLDPWGNDYLYYHNRTNPFAAHNNTRYGYDLWSIGSGADSNTVNNWSGSL